MEFILWIAISGFYGNSQQAALFPTEHACKAAQTQMTARLKETRTSASIVVECLPRGAK